MDELCNVFRLIRVISIGFVYCSSTLARKDKLKFIMLGDFGGMPWRPYSTYGQRLVSQELARVSNVDFFMGLGDNFYFHGVRDVDDERFLTTFEKVYDSPSLYKNWYMIAGNHDYFGNITAQILYSNKSKRWMFPHYFYTKVFKIPKSNKTLQIMLIDTTILCNKWIARRHKAPSPDAQLQWIKHILESSKADYLLVGGHHPMYSAGIHGPNKCIQEKLEDLFKKHRVTAYFSGHDHNLQHIKPEDSSVEYFVSGAANFASSWQLNRRALEPKSLKQFMGQSRGFLVLTATPDRLKVVIRGIKPSQRYRRFLRPRQQHSKKIQYSKLLTDFFSLSENKP